MRTIITAAALSLALAVSAQAAPSGNSFGGKTSITGVVEKDLIVAAIGSRAEATAIVGGVRGNNSFKGDVSISGRVGGRAIVAAIGSRAKAYALVGGVDGK